MDQDRPDSPAVLNANADPDQQFRDYVFASALIPVFGTMPRIREPGSTGDSEAWSQFSDGGVRHATPIAGYFQPCSVRAIAVLPQMLQAEEEVGTMSDRGVATCLDYEADIPAHVNVEQLFLIVANPYDPKSDQIDPPSCCPDGTKRKHVSDGREIALRTLDIALNSPYRWDLNFAVVANEMLEWRAQVYQTARDLLDKHSFDKLKAGIPKIGPFPVTSARAGPDGFALPYKLVTIAPVEVFADTYEIDHKNILKQLHAGCLAADAAMVRTGMTSFAAKCDELPSQ